MALGYGLSEGSDDWAGRMVVTIFPLGFFSEVACVGVGRLASPSTRDYSSMNCRFFCSMNQHLQVSEFMPLLCLDGPQAKVRTLLLTPLDLINTRPTFVRELCVDFVVVLTQGSLYVALAMLELAM